MILTSSRRSTKTFHPPAVLAAPSTALLAPASPAAQILTVADALQPALAAGQRIDTGLLRAEAPLRGAEMLARTVR